MLADAPELERAVACEPDARTSELRVAVALRGVGVALLTIPAGRADAIDVLEFFAAWHHEHERG